MSILKVLTYPHVLLKKKASPVEKFTPGLKDFVNKMIATMNAFEGLGLAAPQVGISKRIIIADISVYSSQESPDAKAWSGKTTFKRAGKEETPVFPMTLINPELKSGSDEIEFPFDGCLSLPGGAGYSSRRLRKVHVTAKDLEGVEIEVETDGILAICLQHEIDHLDGILFIDRLLNPGERNDVISEVFEHENSSEYRKRLKKLKPEDARNSSWDFV